MVCPLRFVIVGASAVVAILAVVYTRQSSEEPKRKGAAPRKEQSMWRTLLDMCTGQYLWHAYLDWRDTAAAEKAT